MTQAVSVVGAGAWGTALAVHLSRRSDLQVMLWARDPAQAGVMAQERVNPKYLPGLRLPEALRITADLAEAAAADMILIASPVSALLEIQDALRAAGAVAPLLSFAKGLLEVPQNATRPSGVALPHQVLAAGWPAAVGAVSGPSFAEEVAQGLPTAVVVAATDRTLATRAAQLLRSDSLRSYESDDLIGIEIGGAVKNVLAIAAGASDGLGFGHNARAALITRGLAETGRLSQALGGRRETLMGLAGLGDLVLTCTGDLSRNRRVGLGLAQGKTLSAILPELGHVAEGVGAARAVQRLAGHYAVEMPICTAVYRVLYERLSPREAVGELLRREPRPEQ